MFSNADDENRVKEIHRKLQKLKSSKFDNKEELFKISEEIDKIIPEYEGNIVL